MALVLRAGLTDFMWRFRLERQRELDALHELLDLVVFARPRARRLTWLICTLVCHAPQSATGQGRSLPIDFHRNQGEEANSSRQRVAVCVTALAHIADHLINHIHGITAVEP